MRATACTLNVVVRTHPTVLFYTRLVQATTKPDPPDAISKNVAFAPHSSTPCKGAAQISVGNLAAGVTQTLRGKRVAPLYLIYL